MFGRHIELKFVKSKKNQTESDTAEAVDPIDYADLAKKVAIYTAAGVGSLMVLNFVLGTAEHIIVNAIRPN